MLPISFIDLEEKWIDWRRSNRCHSLLVGWAVLVTSALDSKSHTPRLGHSIRELRGPRVILFISIRHIGIVDWGR